jgi:transposase
MTSELRAFGDILSGNRQSNQEIKPDVRAAIIAAVTAGQKQSAVARAFHISPSAVTRILQRFKETGSLDKSPRSGRPEVLSPREKRAIIRSTRTDHRVTRKQLVADLDLKVSPSTIKRALNADNMRKWRSKKRIILSKESAAQRLAFICFWSEKEDKLVEVYISELNALVRL